MRNSDLLLGVAFRFDRLSVRVLQRMCGSFCVRFVADVLALGFVFYVLALGRGCCVRAIGKRLKSPPRNLERMD